MYIGPWRSRTGPAALKPMARARTRRTGSAVDATGATGLAAVPDSHPGLPRCPAPKPTSCPAPVAVQLSRASEFYPGSPEGQDRILLVSGTVNQLLTALHLVLSKLKAEPGALRAVQVRTAGGLTLVLAGSGTACVRAAVDARASRCMGCLAGSCVWPANRKCLPMLLPCARPRTARQSSCACWCTRGYAARSSARAAPPSAASTRTATRCSTSRRRPSCPVRAHEVVCAAQGPCSPCCAATGSQEPCGQCRQGCRASWRPPAAPYPSAAGLTERIVKITGDVDHLMRAVALVVTKLRCGRQSVQQPCCRRVVCKR